jgi:hypothetical protein
MQIVTETPSKHAERTTIMVSGKEKLTYYTLKMEATGTPTMSILSSYNISISASIFSNCSGCTLSLYTFVFLKHFSQYDTIAAL